MILDVLLLTNTEETKPNTTKANIHPEHKYAIRGSYIAEIYATYFYRNECCRGTDCREM